MLKKRGGGGGRGTKRTKRTRLFLFFEPVMIPLRNGFFSFSHSFFCSGHDFLHILTSCSFLSQVLLSSSCTSHLATHSTQCPKPTKKISSSSPFTKTASLHASPPGTWDRPEKPMLVSCPLWRWETRWSPIGRTTVNGSQPLSGGLDPTK